MCSGAASRPHSQEMHCGVWFVFPWVSSYWDIFAIHWPSALSRDMKGRRFTSPWCLCLSPSLPDVVGMPWGLSLCVQTSRRAPGPCGRQVLALSFGPWSPFPSLPLGLRTHKRPLCADTIGIPVELRVFGKQTVKVNGTFYARVEWNIMWMEKLWVICERWDLGLAPPSLGLFWWLPSCGWLMRACISQASSDHWWKHRRIPQHLLCTDADACCAELITADKM